MTGPTPKQIAYNKKVADRFERDWTADIHSLNIKRKPRSIFRLAWEWMKPPKHDVYAMYWWVKHYHGKYGFGGRSPFPIDHDNTPIPGYPMKMQAIGWLENSEEGPSIPTKRSTPIRVHGRGCRSFRLRIG